MAETASTRKHPLASDTTTPRLRARRREAFKKALRSRVGFPVSGRNAARASQCRASNVQPTNTSAPDAKKGSVTSPEDIASAYATVASAAAKARNASVSPRRPPGR